MHALTFEWADFRRIGGRGSGLPPAAACHLPLQPPPITTSFSHLFFAQSPSHRRFVMHVTHIKGWNFGGMPMYGMNSVDGSFKTYTCSRPTYRDDSIGWFAKIHGGAVIPMTSGETKARGSSHSSGSNFQVCTAAIAALLRDSLPRTPPAPCLPPPAPAALKPPSFPTILFRSREHQCPHPTPPLPMLSSLPRVFPCCCPLITDPLFVVPCFLAFLRNHVTSVTATRCTWPAPRAISYM